VTPLDRFDYVQTKQPLVGEITGYRQWVLSEDGLYSLNHVKWNEVDGGLTATCRQVTVYDYSEGIHFQQGAGHLNDPTVPLRGCSCGIYSMMFPVDWDDRDVVMLTHDRVLSGISMSFGKYILGTLGLRSQYSYIEAIHLPISTQDYWEAHWQKALVIPPNVKIFRNKADMWEAYPPDDLSHLFDQKTLDAIANARYRFRTFPRNSTKLATADQIREAKRAFDGLAKRITAMTQKLAHFGHEK